jgi:ubiquinone/menaquinone biosynthesis C-methylase UbiE
VLIRLRGDVLDIGAGEGNTLPHLSRDVRLTCVEPHGRSARRLERAAQGRAVIVLRTPAEQLALPDRSMDAAVCAGTLCSVDDPDAVLHEAHRVLRPGGRAVRLEHVAAPAGTWLRRAQRAVAPASRLLDRGCDPARDTESVLRRSPLRIVSLVHTGVRGPFGTVIPCFEAVAERPA